MIYVGFSVGHPSRFKPLRSLVFGLLSLSLVACAESPLSAGLNPNVLQAQPQLPPDGFGGPGGPGGMMPGLPPDLLAQIQAENPALAAELEALNSLSPEARMAQMTALRQQYPQYFPAPPAGGFGGPSAGAEGGEA